MAYSREERLARARARAIVWRNTPGNTDKYKAWCKETRPAINARASKFYHDNRDRLLVERAAKKALRTDVQRAKELKQMADWRAVPANWARGRAKILKARAVKVNCPYSDDIIADLQSQLPQENCICCGKALQWEPRKANAFNPDGPSIDKLIPSLGYVVGNVKIICMRCNALKRDSSIMDLQRILTYARTYSPALTASANG